MPARPPPRRASPPASGQLGAKPERRERELARVPAAAVRRDDQRATRASSCDRRATSPELARWPVRSSGTVARAGAQAEQHDRWARGAQTQPRGWNRRCTDRRYSRSNGYRLGRQKARVSQHLLTAGRPLRAGGWRAMPEGVWRDALADPGPGGRALHDPHAPTRESGWPWHSAARGRLFPVELGPELTGTRRRPRSPCGRGHEPLLAPLPKTRTRFSVSRGLRSRGRTARHRSPAPYPSSRSAWSRQARGSSEGASAALPRPRPRRVREMGAPGRFQAIARIAATRPSPTRKA
jgi:hypothetical protein